MRPWFGLGNSKEGFRKGAFFMVLSSLVMSLFTLFGKFAVETTPYFLFAFLRFLIPLLFLVPYLIWTAPYKEWLIPNQMKLHLLRAGCFIVYQYAFFYYLIKASVLEATVLQNTAPLFLPILEHFFYRHRFDKRDFLSMAVSFAGVLCILQPGSGLIASLGIVAIIVPISQAGSQFLYAHQSRGKSQKSTLFYLFTISSIVAGIIYLFSPELHEKTEFFKNYSLLSWTNIVCLGLATLFNQSLRGIAYRYAKPSSLSPFLYLSLIFSALIDFAVFGRVPNWLSVVGGLLVICGGWIQIYKRDYA
jgi:drug/metabolite transporter (DMT)-like permease